MESSVQTNKSDVQSAVPASACANEDVLLLLRRIADDTEAQKKAARSQSVAAKLEVLCVAVLVAALLGAAVLLAPRVRSTLDEVDVCLEQLQSIESTLSQIDFVAMADSVTELAVNGNESLSVAMGELSGAMDGMNGAIGRINSLDFEKLNSSIDDLGAILDPLSRLFGKK